jgi:hypothetical protein
MAFKWGLLGVIRDKNGIPAPGEFQHYITSHNGSPHGPIVGRLQFAVSERRAQLAVREATWIRLIHPLGVVLARMKQAPDSLTLGTDMLFFDGEFPGFSALRERGALKKQPDGPVAGIARGVKFCCAQACRQPIERLGCKLAYLPPRR